MISTIRRCGEVVKDQVRHVTPLIEEVWRCSGVVVLWKVARDTPGVDHFVRLTKITPPPADPLALIGSCPLLRK